MLYQGDKTLTDDRRRELRWMAMGLPTHPPLTYDEETGGEGTVRDYFPDLSEAEMDELMRIYTVEYEGRMKRGPFVKNKKL